MSDDDPARTDDAGHDDPTMVRAPSLEQSFRHAKQRGGRELETPRRKKLREQQRGTGR